MTRSTTLPILVVLLVAATALGGMDPYSTRQTAGIFVSLDRRAHTLYLDFVAAEFAPAETHSVPVPLKTDIDVWIEGHAVPAGSHDWTFEVDKGGGWSVGEKKTRRNRNPDRFALRTHGVSDPSPWLSASFVPDPEKESVLLRLRFGRKEGVLGLAFREVSGEIAESSEIDVVALRAVRDRMCRMIALIEANDRRRYEWSRCLLELGNALVESPGNGRVCDLRFEMGDQQVTLTVKGVMPGGREAVDEVARKFKRGRVSKLFERVGTPLARGSAEGWTFEISAEAPRAYWDRIEPIDPMFDGTEPGRLAEEVLLLEARLARVASGGIDAMADAQVVLLKAKRESGVLLSEIEIAEVRPIEEGVTSFKVSLTVAGWGQGIVSFIRALEIWKAPLVVIPLSLKNGELCPEARIEIVFYKYVPLAERKAALYGGVRKAGVSPRFEEKRALYLEGIGRPPGGTFTPPQWKRDPFDIPRRRR